MNEPNPHGGESIDLHRIDTPFSHTRVHHPGAVRQLIASIEANGQQVPVIAVQSGERLVLVDGYRRWQALGQLGRDTARCTLWHCPLPAALAQVLARHQARPFEPIEQAWLLSSMVAEGMSQRALAECVGKDPSWVNRRLALLSALSEPLQEAVRAGVISTWAANRVFVPLARANSTHAERLLAQVRSEALSTRELATWLEHYRQGNTTTRERLLSHPRLLIASLKAGQAPDALVAEPEGQWLAELERVCRQLARLRRRLSNLLDPAPPPQTYQALRAGVAKAERACTCLGQPLQENRDAHRAATTDHPRAAPKGSGDPPDQPHPRSLAPHDPAGTEPGKHAAKKRNEQAARAALAAARAVLQDARERGADAGAAA